MIKNFFKILLIFLCLSFQIAYADVMKVNDITFDSSDSVIFIATSGSNGNVNIKKGILSNPDRIFIDIQDAVLTRKQGAYDFKNGKLLNFKISQFSTAPNVVRVVMTCSSQIKPKDIQVLTIGGNVIIKMQEYKLLQDFLTPIYREVKTSAYDYFEKVRISESDVIQSSFPITLAPAMPPSVRPQTVVTPEQTPNVIIPDNEPVRINQPLMESKLQSRFFVSNVYVKQGSLLVAGTGIVNLEKVFYLSNPERVIFDIPNSISASNIRNKEFYLGENETVKVGQFSPTKTRIVVTSPEARKYRAIYSNDLQNILIARDDKLNGVKLFSNTSDIISSNNKLTQEYKNDVDALTLDFSEPIVHSLKRNDNSLELKLYNVNTANISAFAAKIKTGLLKNALVTNIGSVGIDILIPIETKTTIDCLENLNATKLVLTIKTPVTVQKQQQTVKLNTFKKVIVIDPGHGGSDPGATRAKTEEKTLTLDIAEFVVRELKNHGAEVYMTRCDDTFVSLSDRVEYSNAKHPDLFVSIHINASENENVHGIETHYYKDDSLELAKYIHKSIMSGINENNRGVLKSRFYVIRHTNTPAVLLELGFISNEQERELLKDKQRQKKMAELITEGIINYLNNTGSSK